MTWREAAHGVRAWKWTLPSLIAITCFVAVFMQVGADWDWLVALGDHVRSTGEVPAGVPFAAADTSGWRNVPVLSEVFASSLHDLGGWSVGAAHMVLVSLGLIVLAVAGRKERTGDHVVAGALLLLCIGALPALTLIRVQSWSLLFFPLLLLLVTTQARRPDHRIWWAPVLVAVWGNLHGAVLLGVCVLGAYLLCGRLRQRPAETAAVGAMSLIALCLNPQLWWTPQYYWGVLGNVSATRGEGLWARPSLTHALDLALLGASVVLLALVLRRRRAWWEYVALLGLVAATASAARHGVWLLCLLVVLLPEPGGRALGGGLAEEEIVARERRAGTAVTVAVILAIVLPIALTRGDVHKNNPDVVAAVVRTAGDRVVLAPAPLVEAIAVEGITIWAGNPLDAFSRTDQAAYLDFLEGEPGMASAVAESDVVVVPHDSPTAQKLASDGQFSVVACGPGWSCFVRR